MLDITWSMADMVIWILF
jgi:hypothetical protein